MVARSIDCDDLIRHGRDDKVDPLITPTADQKMGMADRRVGEFADVVAGFFEPRNETFVPLDEKIDIGGAALDAPIAERRHRACDGPAVSNFA
jgi:hypothetical protein